MSFDVKRTLQLFTKLKQKFKNTVEGVIPLKPSITQDRPFTVIGSGDPDFGWDGESSRGVPEVRVTGDISRLWWWSECLDEKFLPFSYAYSLDVFQVRFYLRFLLLSFIFEIKSCIRGGSSSVQTFVTTVTNATVNQVGTSWPSGLLNRYSCVRKRCNNRLIFTHGKFLKNSSPLVLVSLPRLSPGVPPTEY